MNISELQKRIENPAISMQQLVEYATNPNSGPPGASVVALAEIQRRKQAAIAKQPMQNQPTVKDQILADAAPQMAMGGITTLAGGGIVGNEDAYAAGGIVAFEEGGDVKSFQLGGMPYTQQRFMEQDIISGYQQALPAIVDKARRGGRLTAEEQGVIDYLNKNNAMPLMTPYIPVMPKETTKLKEDVGIKTLAPAQAAKPAAAPVQSPMVYSTNTPEEIAAKSAQLLRDRFSQPVAPETPAAPAGRGGPAPLPAAPAPVAGFDIQPIQFDDAMYEQMMRKAPTLQEGMKEYMGALGEDPTRAKMAERINQMTEANELYKKQFPWLALAEAGFGMAAGRSPFALQNIAEGGKQGLASFAAGRKESRDQEEKMFNLQAKIAEAERAEKKAALDYGFNSKERIEASNERIKLEKIQNKQATNIANKNLEVQQKELEQKERKMAQDKELTLAEIRARRELGRLPSAEMQMVQAIAAEKKIPLSEALEFYNKGKYEPRATAASLKDANKAYQEHTEKFRTMVGPDGKYLKKPLTREEFFRLNYPELVGNISQGQSLGTARPQDVNNIFGKYGL